MSNDQNAKWTKEGASMQGTLSWLVDHFIGWRVFYFITSIVVGLVSIVIARDFKLDRRLESMFPANSQILNDYLFLKSRFGGNEVVLVVFEKSKLGTDPKDQMVALASLSQRIQRIDGVGATLDLSIIDRLLASNASGLATDTMQFSERAKREFVGLTHSVDEEWLAIVVMLKDETSNPTVKSKNTAQRNVLTAIRSHCDETFKSSHAQYSTDYFLVGEPALVEEGFDLIETDGIRLGWTTSIVLSLFMLICLRSLRWTIATLIVVHWTLWVTQAVCVMARWELTMVSSMLIAMVSVMGISTSMHWLVAYQRAVAVADYSKSVSQHAIKLDALRISLRQVLAPIFWSCVTTSLAFVSLLAANVQPVQDYGTMMAVASMLIFVAIMINIPVIAIFELPIIAPRSEQIAIRRPTIFDYRWIRTLDWSLHRVTNALLHHPKITYAIIAVWMAGIIYGSSQLEVETDFLKNFNARLPIAKGYAIVEEKFGGAGVWDILVPAPERLTQGYFDTISSMEDRIRGLSDEGLTKVISLTAMNRLADEVSITSWLGLEARIQAMRVIMPNFIDSMLADESIVLPTGKIERRWYRIMIRSKEGQTATTKRKLINRVSSIVDNTDFSQVVNDSLIDKDRGKAKVTGYYVLLTHLVQSLIRDQWFCFAAACALIWLATAIALRDFALATIAMIPNTLPSLGVLAAMGIFGWKVNLGAAIITAVSVGISIDASLHYLYSYQRLRQQGFSTLEAVTATQQGIGVPIILATLTLVMGFSALAFSDFQPTVAFGSLSALCMIGSLLGTLWWLPTILIYGISFQTPLQPYPS